MSTTLTTEIKNVTTLSNEGKVSQTWDEDNATWDQSVGTWDNPGNAITTETKNITSLVNEQKNA